MSEVLFFSSLGILFSAVLAVNILHIVRDVVGWHRATRETVLKTHITLHALQKIIERRHGFSKT